MKYLTMAAVVAGLLAQAAGAYAISFSPPRSVSLAPVAEQGASQGMGLTLGLSASSWGQPDQRVIDPTLGDLGVLDFQSQVRPLVTAEYRVNDRFSMGGWYNFIAWDLKYRPVPAFAGLLSGQADVDGGIWEIHGTYELPSQGRMSWSGQAGYQRTDFDGTMQVTAGATTMSSRVSHQADRLVAWGLNTYRVPLASGSQMGLGVLSGLGLAQGLNRGGTLALHAVLGASVAFTPAISADASLWLTDFSRDGSKARFTAGVTGRF